MKRISQYRLIFLLILLIAGGLRWYGLTNQPLSLQEIRNTELSTQPLTVILRASDGMPPFYPCLLKAWRCIFPGAIAIRMMSVTIGLLSIVALRRLAAEATNSQVALIAAALAAISPFHLYLSQDGSHCGLVLLLGTLAIRFGLRIMRGPNSQFSRRSDSMALVLVAAAGLYSDYYFSLLLIAIGVGTVFTRRLTWLARHQVHALGMITTLYLLTAPLLLLLPGDLNHQQFSTNQTESKLPAITQILFSFESGYGLGPTRTEQQTMTNSEAFRKSARWLIPILATTSCLFLLGIAASSREGEQTYWLCLFGIPTLTLMIISGLLHVPFDERHISYCWLPYCLPIAIGFTVLLPKPRAVLSLLMCCIYGLAFFNRHHIKKYQNAEATVSVMPVQSESSSVNPKHLQEY